MPFLSKQTEKLAVLEATNLNLKTEISRLTQTIDELRKSKAEEMETKKRLQEQKRELEDKMNGFKIQVDEEKTQLQFYKNQSEERIGQIMSEKALLQVEVSSLKMSLEDKFKSLNTTSLQSTKMENQMKLLEAELEEKKKRIKEGDDKIKSYGQKLSKLEMENNEMKRKHQDLLSNLDQKEKTIKSHLEQLNQYKEKLQLSTTVSTTSVDQIKALTLQIEALEARLAKKDAVLASTKAKMKEVDQKAKTLETTLENLQKERDSLSSQLKSKETAMQGYVNQNTKQAQAMDLVSLGLKQQLSTLKLELEEKVEEKDNFIKNLRLSLGEGEKAIDATRQELKDVQMKLEAMSQKCAKDDEKMSFLSEMNQGYQSTIATLEQGKRLQEEQQRNLETTIASLNTVIRKLKRESITKEEHQEMLDELELKEKKIQTLKACLEERNQSLFDTQLSVWSSPLGEGMPSPPPSPPPSPSNLLSVTDDVGDRTRTTGKRTWGMRENGIQPWSGIYDMYSHKENSETHFREGKNASDLPEVVCGDLQGLAWEFSRENLGTDLHDSISGYFGKFDTHQEGFGTDFRDTNSENILWEDRGPDFQKNFGGDLWDNRNFEIDCRDSNSENGRMTSNEDVSNSDRYLQGIHYFRGPRRPNLEISEGMLRHQYSSVGSVDLFENSCKIASENKARTGDGKKSNLIVDLYEHDSLYLLEEGTLPISDKPAKTTNPKNATWNTLTTKNQDTCKWYPTTTSTNATTYTPVMPIPTPSLTTSFEGCEIPTGKGGRGRGRGRGTRRGTKEKDGDDGVQDDLLKGRGKKKKNTLPKRSKSKCTCEILVKIDPKVASRAVVGSQVLIQLQENKFHILVNTLPVPGSIVWRRANEDVDYTKEELTDMNTGPTYCLIMFTGIQFSSLIVNGSLGTFVDGVNAHYVGSKVIVLIEGIEVYLRQSALHNQQLYREKVLANLKTGEEPMKSASWKSGHSTKNTLGTVVVKREQIEESCLFLQIEKECQVIQTETSMETVEYIISFTTKLAEQPYKKKYAFDGCCIEATSKKNCKTLREAWVTQLEIFPRTNPFSIT
eukprot:TRINITY_DN6128_c0_g1_i6.p1 TRINITY_DN6128_c0_g1~~TRINITY_DN6128_c0_g1_i6.p1  ORF type:complete len:1068 (+),score=283.18 TRINITY_DN6128_c0_g1_i6:1958-5161(+)